MMEYHLLHQQDRHLTLTHLKPISTQFFKIKLNKVLHYRAPIAMALVMIQVWTTDIYYGVQQERHWA